MLSRTLTAIATGAVVVGLAASAAHAQPARLANARVTTQPGAALPQAFRAAVDAQADDAGWVGYSVPTVAGDRTMCCFDGGTSIRSGGDTCCGLCRLEPDGPRRDAAATMSSTSPGTVKLEGPDTMVLLFRIVKRQVERVRVFSEACALDAGGRQVVWLENVQPSQSLALLSEMIETRPAGERTDRVIDGAIAAVALHREAAATAVLERLLAPSQRAEVRAAVPFWLGTTRGSAGLDILERLLREDASDAVRKRTVFAISQSAEPRAVDLLIGAARSHADGGVRGEAVFWLAQKAGRKASAAISDRIENDPDTEVKKKAVFALSQLPKDEGVPLLLQVARTHTNPAVRKQAMFWLGESRDPRAIDFFAEVLK